MSYISLYNITKDQTNIIKTVAILLIVFHNFIHLIINLGENEMSLDPQRISIYINTITENGFITFFNYTLSFLGHYGVQLFVFISGYGLTKQYSQKKNISYKNYIIPKIVKIYALLIFGIITYALLFINKIELKSFLYEAIWSLSMLNNLSTSRLFSFVGPWWYFSLIIQLYILFPLLFKILVRKNNLCLNFIFLLCISYVMIYILTPITDKYNIPLYANFVGHLPEFLLGMFLALSDRFRLSFIWVIPASILFILSNISNYFFPFSFLSVTILLLFLCYPLITYSKGILLKALLYIGSISMFIFVINGPLRDLTRPLFEGKSGLMIFLGSFIHCGLVMIISALMKIIYDKTFAPLSQRLIKLLTK